MRMVIEISTTGPGPHTEFGAGVLVKTEPFNTANIPPSEGCTWAGICMAINDYMHSRGAHDFDCLKRMQ